MAVNESIYADYDDATPSNNSPAGSTAIGQDLDNHLRDIKKNIRLSVDWGTININDTSSPYTVSASAIHKAIMCNPTSGAIQVNIPDAAVVGAGWSCKVVRDIDGATGLPFTGGALTVVPAGGKVDGTATISLVSSFASLTFVSNGVNWHVEGHGRKPGGKQGLAATIGLTGIAADTAIVADGDNGLKSAGYSLAGLTDNTVVVANGSGGLKTTGALLSAIVQNNSYTTLSSVSGINTITASATPAITAYAAGQVFQLVPSSANTGAVTLSINGLAATAVQSHGAALTNGQLQASVGVMVMYDGSAFQVLGHRLFPSILGLTAGHAIIADSTGTGIKSAGKIFEEVLEVNTTAVFLQAAAPATWTRANETNEYTIMLARAVDTGNGIAGSWTISGLTNGAVGATTLTAAQSGLPSHTHTIPDQRGDLDRTGGNGYTWNEGVGQSTGATGGTPASESHTHTAPTISSDGTWRPAHRIALKCTKNTPVSLA